MAKTYSMIDAATGDLKVLYRDFNPKLCSVLDSLTEAGYATNVPQELTEALATCGNVDLLLEEDLYSMLSCLLPIAEDYIDHVCRVAEYKLMDESWDEIDF